MLRLLRGLKPYLGAVILGFGFVLAQVYSDLKLPDIMSDVVDRGIAQGDIGYIASQGIRMLGFALLVLVFSSAVQFMSSRTSSAFGRDLREKVFSAVERFSLPEFDRFSTSSLITRATNDGAQVQQFVQVLLTGAVSAPFTFVGAAYMALSKDRDLALIVFATIPLVLGIVALVMGRALPLLRSMQEKIDNLNRVVRESLTGVRVVRAYARERHEERRFREVSRDYTETTTRIARFMGLQLPLIFLVINLATVAILYVGAQRIDLGATQVGQVMAVLQYATQMLFSVMAFSIVFSLLPRAMASANRISEVLDTDPAIVDDPDARPSDAGRTGSFAFERVTFLHPGAQSPALEDVSFEVAPGEKVAIVGSTGSGKTTLIQLLLRFYDPTSGRVLLGGEDIRHMRQFDVRQHLGYAPQRAYLFSGTIRDNIAFGHPEATDEELEHAAWVAAADGFVEAAGGLDARVSHGGGNLSGGQRQRLSIARAVISKPSILILDDTFSALDFRTEALVRDRIDEHVGDATMLIVTQRVATAQRADRVIVLDEGRIVGIGTHEQLISACGVYAEIVASQECGEEVMGDE